MNKLLALAAAAVVASPAPGFVPALPGYHFVFPRDHASHPAYKTEWWYYTGHLTAPGNRKFGFELTFFRFGQSRAVLAPGSSRWRFGDLYVAHFALTDAQGHTFHAAERLERPGLGLAGASQDTLDVHVGAWLAALLPKGEHHLRARDGGSAIDLVLTPAKPPAIHGHAGVSQKSDCPGCASHYYSLTRLVTNGVLSLGGERLPVKGLAWMDHEFGSAQLAKSQLGWDWFSLQLDDQAELMLYRLRLPNGQVEPASSGSLIRADGSTVPLPLAGWSVDPTGSWTSPRGGHYPMGWHVKVPGQALDVALSPVLEDQELSFPGVAGATYWEGAVDVKGSHAGKPVTGDGYVEMTGYAPGSRPSL